VVGVGGLLCLAGRSRGLRVVPRIRIHHHGPADRPGQDSTRARRCGKVPSLETVSLLPARRLVDEPAAPGWAPRLRSLVTDRPPAGGAGFFRVENRRVWNRLPLTLPASPLCSALLGCRRGCFLCTCYTFRSGHGLQTALTANLPALTPKLSHDFRDELLAERHGYILGGLGMGFNPWRHGKKIICNSQKNS
jgi:hypothetical protein